MATNHKSYQKEITSLTEKIGYLEAKQKILEGDRTEKPRRVRQLQTEMNNERSKIRAELNEVAKMDDLRVLEDSLKNTHSKKLVDLEER